MPTIVTCDRCGKQLVSKYGSVSAYLRFWGDNENEEVFACTICQPILATRLLEAIRIWRKGG